MPEEKTEKKKFHATLKSDFSMGALDFERYHQMLILGDVLSVRAKSYDTSCFREYFAILDTLYMNFYPIMKQADKTSLQKKLDELEAEILKIARVAKTGSKPQYSIAVLKLFREIHLALFVVKQFSGLGISVSKDMTGKQKLERAFGIGGKQ